jgi:protein O-GlcNAc transferase
MSQRYPGTARNEDMQPLIARAAELHQTGRLEEAADLYKEVLARSPHDFDAAHLLGVIALQQGKFDVAQRLINGALALNPNHAAALGNLGIAYLRAGQFEQALQWFEIAVKLEPDSARALTNAGEVLYYLGRYRTAISLLQKACSIDPMSYPAHNLLGACFLNVGQQDSAAISLETATRLQPDNAEAWANFSLAMGAIGEKGRAREYADKAARLKPDSAKTLQALAHTQLDQGRIADAVESYRRGLSREEPSVNTLVAYANALMANSLHDEAREQLQRALSLDEKNLAVRWALTLGQLKTIYDSEAEVIESRSALRKALDDLQSWYEHQTTLDAPYNVVGTIQPFQLAYQHVNNRDLLKRYGELCAAFMTTLPRHAAVGVSLPPIERRLRLGIVSAHIREHSVYMAITKGWLQHLDRDRFDIHVFHLSTVVDEETEAAMKAVSNFDNRTKSLSAWVEAIDRAQLDVILYPEIGMDPLTAKLAALRLAPLQAVSWGHPETSGLPTMDIFLSAQAFEPAEAAQGNYTERLVALPNLGVYVEPLALRSSEPDLEALRLPIDQPLLICAGSPFKYAPRYDEVWVEIAKGLQKKGLFGKSVVGRLVFFRSQNVNSDRIFERRLRAAFKSGGTDFDAHVSIVPFLDHAVFFGLLGHAALMLDTLGFSGFNTALQGIECGLPVLAFEGDFLRGRLASALLRELGLNQLVATTQADFVHKAVSLAKKPDVLRQLRSEIVRRRADLFRNLAPIRALEQCLTEATTRQ